VAIAQGSLASLLLGTSTNNIPTGSATGFVVERAGARFLVTNFHVLAGRDPQTGANLHPLGAWPDRISIFHNLPKAGTWQQVHESVRTDEGPLWLEHPLHGRRVDVVALPLTSTEGLAFYPYHLPEQPFDVHVGVTTSLSIIGFPFGKTGAGRTAVWIQGTIASEPSLNFNDLPCFLIDSRTREGQSGSPVVFYSAGGAVLMSDGSVSSFVGPQDRLLGVYSGRINAESDLGFVWHARVIKEIIDGGIRGADS
jgi:Trypsin-like peptidase domain